MQIFFFSMADRLPHGRGSVTPLRRGIRDADHSKRRAAAEQPLFFFHGGAGFLLPDPPGRQVRRVGGHSQRNQRGRGRSRRGIAPGCGVELLGSDGIVIAAHFDLIPSAQRRRGLDEREHLSRDVVQQEALFGRNRRRCRSRSGRRGVSQLLFQFHQPALCGEARIERMVFLPMKCGFIGGQILGWQAALAGSAAKGSRSPEMKCVAPLAFRNWSARCRVRHSKRCAKFAQRRSMADE